MHTHVIKSRNAANDKLFTALTFDVTHVLQSSNYLRISLASKNSLQVGL